MRADGSRDYLCSARRLRRLGSASGRVIAAEFRNSFGSGGRFFPAYKKTGARSERAST